MYEVVRAIEVSWHTSSSPRWISTKSPSLYYSAVTAIVCIKKIPGTKIRGTNSIICSRCGGWKTCLSQSATYVVPGMYHPELHSYDVWLFVAHFFPLLEWRAPAQCTVLIIRSSQIRRMMISYYRWRVSLLSSVLLLSCYVSLAPTEYIPRARTGRGYTTTEVALRWLSAPHYETAVVSHSSWNSRVWNWRWNQRKLTTTMRWKLKIHKSEQSKTNRLKAETKAEKNVQNENIRHKMLYFAQKLFENAPGSK